MSAPRSPSQQDATVIICVGLPGQPPQSDDVSDTCRARWGAHIA